MSGCLELPFTWFRKKTVFVQTEQEPEEMKANVTKVITGESMKIVVYYSFNFP